MTEATDPIPDAPPVQQVETLDDRIRRLEAALSVLQTQQANAAIAATETGLVPSALFGAIAPGLAPSPPEAAFARVPFVQEVRLMGRMYLDARYRLSRLAQFGVPAIIALMVLNFFFLGSVPYVGFLFERVALIVLAIALYKILSREAARYAAVLAYLTRYTVPR
jgi:hypothetical protein